MNAVLNAAQIIAAIATAAGVIAAVIIYRNQTNAQVFLEYTKRYEEIMSALPIAARVARTDSDSALPDATPELTFQILRYLNLCAEEFYLMQRGYLAREIWSIWDAELTRTLRTPLLMREWEKLRNEFSSYPAFQNYVRDLQSTAAATPFLRERA
jgi:hypothetical protein